MNLKLFVSYHHLCNSIVLESIQDVKKKSTVARRKRDSSRDSEGNMSTQSGTDDPLDTFERQKKQTGQALAKSKEYSNA